MNGPIAQCVALVCYGNAVLGGMRGLYFQDNSTARFYDRIEFAEPAPGDQVATVAESPDAWFAYLARAGVSGLQLSRAPQGRPLASDRMSAGLYQPTKLIRFEPNRER